MFNWVRRNFIAGFFVTVPLVISVAALVWIFRLIDGLVGPIYEAWLPGPHHPGPGPPDDGARRAAGRDDRHQRDRKARAAASRELPDARPVFRTIYAPVKQLVVAFSPDNEYGFKRVALVEDAAKGYMLGFLTKELSVERGRGTEPFLAVYVPTNHLYLGDVILCPRDKVTFPDITVEQGIRIFLTGGMALPGRLRFPAGESHPPDGRG